MIAVAERVLSASVKIGEEITGQIGSGLLVLLGVEQGDTPDDLNYIVRKTAGLRIFPSEGKMSLSIQDTKGALLVVSQFTLHGDVRRGFRPDFSRAAQPETAKKMYEDCIAAFRALGIETHTGRFGAYMRVEREGDGPVTILLDSRRRL